MKLAKLVVLFSLLSVSVAVAVAEPDKWTFVDGDDGIHVWRQDIPGHEVPAFRGQTFIKASIDDILKQMLDWRRHTEWMFACAESALLKQIDPNHMIMYNRIGAPWPVWDRDVIVDTLIERSPDGKQLKVSFNNVDSKLRALPKRVIRLPRLIGFYKLWEIEPKKTKIMYQVEAELGGSIPRWLAVSGARDLPHHTLDGLRKRVEGQAK